MTTREERLVALLAQPEGAAPMPDSIPAGLLQAITPDQLAGAVQSAIATQAAGEALHQARRQRELSLRQAGAASGRSAPRVKAIEGTDLDIHLGTVVEHAQALGYEVKLVLTAVTGGRPIEAHLTAPEKQADADQGPTTTMKGETRLKVRAASRVKG
ncbi:hypothetical protein [Deinococcus marmoris]|uniref:hypothetical protein n=1 Tax=Deinococcus marmoris TaxID=249408 RepID=UPI00096AAF82|nr:hypothetical protein [Deinococcus marmoris]